MALIAYLAVEPGPHTRAQLSALLWPEADEAHASMSLRQALARLREVVGDRLQTDRTQVALNRRHVPPLTSDYAHFCELISSAPLEAAQVGVHRFLSTLPVDDAPDLLHWMDLTRVQLTRNAVAGLDRCAAEAAARRDWATVARSAQRWLEFAPLSEAAASRAVEAACMRRDFAQARAIRDDYLARLRADGLSGGAGAGRVDELLRRLESLVTPTPPRGVVASAGTEHGSDDARVLATSARTLGPFLPALRDRDAVWASLRRAFERVESAGVGERVLLSGALGSGRSRLLQDAAAWMASRSATVLVAETARTGLALPYFVIASLIRSGVDTPALAGIDGPHLRTLMELVPELGERFPSLRRGRDAEGAADGAFAWRLQEALWQALLAMTEDGPVVLALDDVLWGDRESAVVLQMILRRPDAAPLLWLLSGADERASESSQHAWHEVIHGATVLALPPLSEASIIDMLVDHYRMSGAPASERAAWAPLAARLHAASHGLAGLVTAAVEELRLEVGDDPARLQDLTPPVPMLPIAQQRRIDELDDMSEVALLSLALVMEAGHPVPAHAWHARPALTVERLSHLHGISRLRAAMIGQRLVAARLAVESEEGYRCASPAVVEHMLKRSSALLVNELRRVM